MGKAIEEFKNNKIITIKNKTKKKILSPVLGGGWQANFSFPWRVLSPKHSKNRGATLYILTCA